MAAFVNDLATPHVAWAGLFVGLRASAPRESGRFAFRSSWRLRLRLAGMVGSKKRDEAGRTPGPPAR